MRLKGHLRSESLAHGVVCAASLRQNDVELLCGDSVEARDDGIFEGAWVGRAETSNSPVLRRVRLRGTIIAEDLIIVGPKVPHSRGIFGASTGTCTVKSRRTPIAMWRESSRRRTGAAADEVHGGSGGPQDLHELASCAFAIYSGNCAMTTVNSSRDL